VAARGSTQVLQAAFQDEFLKTAAAMMTGAKPFEHYLKSTRDHNYPLGAKTLPRPNTSVHNARETLSRNRHFQIVLQFLCQKKINASNFMLNHKLGKNCPETTASIQKIGPPLSGEYRRLN